jgi:flagellar hook assembly protein FlgD
MRSATNGNTNERDKSVGETDKSVGGTDKSVPYCVQINIYNIKGQKVRTLVNDTFSPGTHKVIWNGTDDSGKAVSSGIYFYKMKAGDYTETRKMLLMK